MFNKDLIIKAINNMGWSKYRLCKEANLSQSTLSDILTGKNKNPRMDTIQKVADALNVNVFEFFDEGVPVRKEDYEEFDNNNDIQKLSDDSKLLVLIQQRYGKKSTKLLEDFTKLNDLGKTEAIKRTYELTQIPTYINTELGMAAHNDYADDQEQQKLMQEDLDEL